VVAAIYSIAHFHPHSTNLTLGADAARYDIVFPQYAAETDRSSVCGNGMVSVVSSVVYAEGLEDDSMDSWPAGPRTHSLSKRLQLLIGFGFSVSAASFFFDTQVLCFSVLVFGF